MTAATNPLAGPALFERQQFCLIEGGSIHRSGFGRLPHSDRRAIEATNELIEFRSISSACSQPS